MHPARAVGCQPSLDRIALARDPSWVWWGQLWQVAGGGFLGWLAWGWANEHRGVARTAPLIYLMPVVAGLSAWAFTGERFTWQKVLAAGVVLAGVAVAQFGNRPPKVTDATGIDTVAMPFALTALDATDAGTAHPLHALLQVAHAQEAALLLVSDLPALRRSVMDLQNANDDWIGAWAATRSLVPSPRTPTWTTMR